MDSKHLQAVRGLTLIELLIVIVVITVLAIFTVPRWTSNNISVGAQARQLASHIRYTQALSMSSNTRYRFVKLSNTTYQIQNASGTPIILSSGTTTVTLNTSISFGTLTNLPNNLLVFSGNGTPYTDTATPGTALASTATIPITNGTFTQTISITPQTGRVLIQ